MLVTYHIASDNADRFAGQSAWQLHGHLALLPDGRPHWAPQPPPPPSNNIAMELVGNGFNARLSDSLSLDRNITDNRHPMCRRKTFDLHTLPKASVVIVRRRGVMAWRDVHRRCSIRSI